MDVYSVTGYTPLFAAISGRQWGTAKLIIAILVEQYTPDEELIKFDADDVNLGMIPSSIATFLY